MVNGLTGAIRFAPSQEVECPLDETPYEHHVTAEAPPGRFIFNGEVASDEPSCGVSWYWPKGESAQISGAVYMGVPNVLHVEAERISLANAAFININQLEFNASDAIHFDNAGVETVKYNESNTSLAATVQPWPATSMEAQVHLKTLIKKP